jgi:uncharacterized protein (TIGR02145 family)
MRFPICLALFVLALFAHGQAPPTIDGYTYKTVKIGDQEWFAENLRTREYDDGSAIQEVTDHASWSGLTTGARCNYDNDARNVATYGRLYNWYAVDAGRGLCPSGWRIPSDEDWQDLEVFLGMSRADVSLEGERGSGELSIGTKLKAKSGWRGNGNGTDDFGFSALPGGNRSFLPGDYVYNAGDYGYWWSSSPVGGNAWYRNLNDGLLSILRLQGDAREGFSVRCLRDAE